MNNFEKFSAKPPLFPKDIGLEMKREVSYRIPFPFERNSDEFSDAIKDKKDK